MPTIRGNGFSIEIPKKTENNSENVDTTNKENENSANSVFDEKDATETNNTTEEKAPEENSDGWNYAFPTNVGGGIGINFGTGKYNESTGDFNGTNIGAGIGLIGDKRSGIGVGMTISVKF